MPWISQVKGVLEAYLGGQAVGQAVVDVLFGKVNPSGRLAETFPLKLEDNPSYLYYVGEKDTVEYREGIFVGYRYYDKKNMNVLFPFGYGLSYTTFAYSNLQIDKTSMNDQQTLQVSIDVTNTGKIAGKEVVQLYVADVESAVIRPIKELKGFAKVHLEPGETRTVSFKLGKRAFAYYNTEISDWHVESGEFLIQVGCSSRDIVCEQSILVESTVKLPVYYTLNSTFGDFMLDPQAFQIVKHLMDQANEALEAEPSEESAAAAEAITTEMQDAMMKYMPVRAVVSFNQDPVTFEELQALLEKANHRPASLEQLFGN
jgi:beta-glucosidase